MTSSEPKPPVGGAFGRLILLFDASPGSLDALAVASQMAQVGKRLLEAVLVEDADLVRSAGFVFAAEVGSASGALQRLDAGRMEQRLSWRRRQVEQRLHQVMAQSELEYRLRILRGRLSEQVLELAGPDDLIVAGRVGYSGRCGRLLGSEVLKLVRGARATVLLPGRETLPAAGRIIVLIERSDAADALIELGMERARWNKAAMTVMVTSDLADEAYLAMIRQRLRPVDRVLGVVAGAQGSPWRLRRLLAGQSAVELVLGRSGNLLTGSAAADMLATVRVTLMVGA
jgi:nucleotide-binding universal stress UspA family protein